MTTKKMSLANIQGKLNRDEMKRIMAGSGNGTCKICEVDWCKGLCYCSSGMSSCSSACTGAC